MRHIGTRLVSLLASVVFLVSTSPVLLSASGLEQQPKPEEWKMRLTSEERAAITRPDSPNDRVKTYMRLAEQRLKNARDLINREEYVHVNSQISAYVALVADAGKFTKESVAKRDKAHKTLETTLREQLRLLEGIRRDTTSDQSDLMEEAVKIVAQVRRQSLNLLLGDNGILAETDKP